MLERVTGLIVHQYIEAAQVPLLLEGVNAQIHLETTGGMTLQREQTVFFVPDGFIKPYKAVFPELYKKIYGGLADKSRTHDALVEVTYDFLTRWGLTFQQFEEYHRTFFDEICDRTVAKENNSVPFHVSESPGIEEAASEMAGLTEGQIAIRLSRLADEVMKSVEQDMRSFRTQKPQDEEPAVAIASS